MSISFRRSQPIYCIGDSHASFFSGAETIQPLWPKSAVDLIPCFRSIRIGPVLAYALASWGTRSKGREILSILLNREAPDSDKQVPTGAAVMLCFGEIDCRCHVIPQAKRSGRSAESVVAEVGQRYCEAVQEIRSWGYRPLIWNVIPSTPRTRGGNSAFPIDGSCEERNRVTRLLNQKLGEWCRVNDIHFVDIYEHLVDQHGATRDELLMDGFHLSQRAMPIVLDWFREHAPEFIPDGFSISAQPERRSFAFRVLRLDNGIRRVRRGLLQRWASTPAAADSVDEASNSESSCFTPPL